MKINESLGFILGVANKKLKHNLEKTLNNYNLTTAQWSVLKLLSEKDSLTQVEIAENLMSDKMTAGSVVEKLIKKNLIIRERSEIDKRRYVICILDEGRKIVSTITKCAIETNEKAVRGFKEEDIYKLEKYLCKIINNFEEDK